MGLHFTVRFNRSTLTKYGDSCSLIGKQIDTILMHARNTTGVQYHVTRSACMHVETYAEVIVCSLPLKVKPTQCVYHELLGCILLH